MPVQPIQSQSTFSEVMSNQYNLIDTTVVLYLIIPHQSVGQQYSDMPPMYANQ